MQLDNNLDDVSSGTSSQASKRSSYEQPLVVSGIEPHERLIGPLPVSERRRRVLRYLRKKYAKDPKNQFCYSCRKQVAEKRLRIKGRFVTKE